MAKDTNKIAAALETIRAGLAATRAQIEAKKQELDRVRAAPLGRDEAVARLDAWLMGVTAQHRPAVGAFILADGGLPPTLWPSSAQEQGAVLAALLGDRIRDMMIGAIDEALAERPPGLAAKDRPAAIAKVEAELLELEVAEEKTIRAAEEAGLALARRPDADPRVILAKLAA